MDGILTAAEWTAQGGSLSTNNMRTNALLRRDEWVDMDQTLIDVVRVRRNLVSDLIGAGLTRQLGGLGSTVASYEMLGDMDDADVHMSVRTNVDRDRVTFQSAYVPIPIHSKPFCIDARQLDASRRMGESLDTTHVRVATVKVQESMERMAMNGHTVAVQQNGALQTIYGFRNLPSRISDTAANFGGGDFATEDNGYKVVSGMMAQLAAAGYYGPYGCYISRAQYSELHSLKTDGSAISNIASIQNNLSELSYVRPSDFLADGEVILFQLSSEVVQIAIGQDITVVEWDGKGGLVDNFIVMSAMAPLVKGSASGVSGVAHATGA